jgi:predicted GIY-YIG superfamily endonuclease
MTDNTNIYILKLKGGNYYVGKTHNVEKRFKERAKLKS